MSLYHYTDKDALRSIKASGVLLASHTFGRHGRDAVLGEGVYLTDLQPSTSTDKILQNNYGQAAGRVYRENPNVTDAYIKIPMNHVHAQWANMGAGRRVYVVKTSYGLDIRNIPCEYGHRV